MKKMIEAVSSEIQQKSQQIFQQKKKRRVVVMVPIWKLTKVSLGVVVAVKLGKVLVRKIKQQQQQHELKKNRCHKLDSGKKQHQGDSAMLDHERNSESDSNHVYLSSYKDSQQDDSAFQEDNEFDDTFESVFHDYALQGSPCDREDEYHTYTSQFDLYEQVCSQSFGGSDYWNTTSREIPHLDSTKISKEIVEEKEDPQQQISLEN
eukprot:TRINITY_DN27851_c0_g1_i1.p2 TRINITY_DN27851_c0_g1~~TRINITY_DN27851_c0_g1_i1.p2  ORF type:complete len:206 (+),score=34.95 TRINITY_DN27851_c0_g1_i1:143-760(+)